MCGEPGTSVVDVDRPDRLARRQVARPRDADLDGTRYRLLEPLRQWAHDELAVNGELDAVRRAHAHHFARLVVDDSPRPITGHGQEVALRRTAADYPNVRLALATLAEAGDADEPLAMCFGLFVVLGSPEHARGGIETCRRSLDLAVGDPTLAAVKTAFVGAVCGAWTRRPTRSTIAATACESGRASSATRARSPGRNSPWPS